MGMYPQGAVRLEPAALRVLAARLSDAGIAGLIPVPLEPDPSAVLGWLRAVHQMLAGSPTPGSEWPALVRRLGLDLLARLVLVSPASARRYAAGTRRTPDAIADRLHFLALLVGDLLAGAYTDIGIRRWFERRRTALDGRAPADLLTAPWMPDDEGPEKVRQLAAALAFSPAT